MCDAFSAAAHYLTAELDVLHDSHPLKKRDDRAASVFARDHRILHELVEFTYNDAIVVGMILRSVGAVAEAEIVERDALHRWRQAKAAFGGRSRH